MILLLNHLVLLSGNDNVIYFIKVNIPQSLFVIDNELGYLSLQRYFFICVFKIEMTEISFLLKHADMLELERKNYHKNYHGS